MNCFSSSSRCVGPWNSSYPAAAPGRGLLPGDLPWRLARRATAQPAESWRASNAKFDNGGTDHLARGWRCRSLNIAAQWSLTALPRNVGESRSVSASNNTKRTTEGNPGQICFGACQVVAKRPALGAQRKLGFGLPCFWSCPLPHLKG